MVVKVSQKKKIFSGCLVQNNKMENEDVLASLAEQQNLSGTLFVNDKSYQIKDISVAKSTIPVRKPTTRGGVYFTDTTAYKIKATTKDLSIVSEIPKLMLGPNTDFVPILLKTETRNKGQVTLTTHLTNAVNTKEKVELHLIADKVDLK